MRRVYLAELRDSWSAWLGVAVVFLGVGVMLAASGLVVSSGWAAVAAGDLDIYLSTPFLWLPLMYLLAAGLVGISVIGGATGLVVDSRRGSLARLALAGATPRQVRRSVTTQVVAVTLACAVAADLVAAAALPWLLTIMPTGATPEERAFIPPPVWDLRILVATNLLTVLLAVGGARRQARRASELSPVEALRAAAVAGPERRRVPMRWVRAGLGVAVLAMVFVALPAVLASSPRKEAMSNTLLAGYLALIIGAAVLATLAPLVTGPLTALWTRWLPARSPVWRLARRNVAVRGERLARSVVPVMLSVSLLVGSSLLGPTMLSSAEAAGYAIPIDKTGTMAVVMLLAPPLIVALCGSVGSLFMMSKQRDAELALAGLVGATPRQRMTLPVIEAVIITTTATILAVAPVATMVAMLAYGLPLAGFPVRIVVPLDGLAISLGFTGAVTILAVWLPTWGPLRLPERRVIARLVAE